MKTKTIQSRNDYNPQFLLKTKDFIIFFIKMIQSIIWYPKFIIYYQYKILEIFQFTLSYVKFLSHKSFNLEKFYDAVMKITVLIL